MGAVLKQVPFVVVATAQVLGAGYAQLGTVAVNVSALASATLSFLYSGGGTPTIEVQFSADPPQTNPNAIAHWEPVQILDGASFAAGVINAYTYAVVEPAGTTSFGWPCASIDCGGYFWLRVMAKDATAGSLSLKVGGVGLAS